jgi:hypothetical protein
MQRCILRPEKQTRRVDLNYLFEILKSSDASLLSGEINGCSRESVISLTLQKDALMAKMLGLSLTLAPATHLLEDLPKQSLGSYLVPTNQFSPTLLSNLKGSLGKKSCTTTVGSLRVIIP